MPPDLQIFLLGSFRLIVKGHVVSNSAWEKRKAKLLLQILALKSSHELHREELIEFLFPELDERSAGANLSRVLHAVRKVLEPERPSYSSSNYLITDGEQIRLAVNDLDVWIDIKEFEQKARDGLKKNDRGQLETAAELYKGDLLSDLPFEDWINDKRERYKRLFQTVLRRMAEIEEKNDAENAHFWLDKILEYEPADEIAHRAKMRLYAGQGETILALRQYEKCRQALERELEIEPDDETKTLRQKIYGRHHK